MKIGCAKIVRIAACVGAALLFVGTVVTSSVALAAWPDRTITIIVPFPPGGPNDLLGRLLAAEMAPKLGQNVIVENRAGAVGNIGLAAGARAVSKPALKRDEIDRASAFCLSMISAQTRSAFVARENRFTLFRIML